MKSKITKFAAAAVIIIAAMSITYLGQLTAPTYAITQTIEANRGMRYLHTKYFDELHDDVGKECWLEFDESGLPKNVRINWSEWMGNGQIQIVLWNQDQTQIWQKKQNRRDRLLVFNDEIFTSRIHHMTESDDPRVTVEELYERQAKGEVKVEIKEPGNRSEPIVVTATRLGGSKRRFVLYVDQATKLVTACEWYQLKDGEYEYEGVTKYYDYNVPIDAKMFSFDGLSGDVKRDVKRIDTAVDDIGLAQGSLSDEEIAVKVVREYFDALIASIGEPVPPSKPSKLFPKRLFVPYKIEIEKDGKKTSRERQQDVRRVLGRRERWIIQGSR
jgi:hypothetical protein